MTKSEPVLTARSELGSDFEPGSDSRSDRWRCKQSFFGAAASTVAGKAAPL